MKYIIKFSLILVTVISLLISLYCFTVIISANRKTPDFLKNIYSSGKIKIKFEDLTQEQLNILLKVEDPNFYNHKGVDFKTPGAGITTITQGLVKKLHFENFKPGFRKIKQTLIARYVLDKKLEKNKQIELFINLMYFGSDAYGMKDAARIHFNKDFNELTRDEYISLVAMIVAPVYFDVTKHPDRNAARVAAIKSMLSGDYKPKGLMDLYYGNTPNKDAKGIKAKLKRRVWGY